MDITIPRTSAYLIAAGVVLAALSMLVVDVVGHDGSLLAASCGAVTALAGSVAAMTGLVRWALRGRTVSVPIQTPRTHATV